MQVSTRAIVLSHTKYSDSSIIVHVYTEVLGRISLIVYGTNNKKKNKLSYFQPLYLLDLTLVHKANRNIQTLKELKANPVLPNLTIDFIKSTQAIFIAEVLSKSLHQQEGDNDLFEYLSSSIQILNQLDTDFSNFHLAFIIKLSKHLGFALTAKDFTTGYLDFRSGHIQVEKPNHPFFIEANHFNTFKNFQTVAYDRLNQINLTGFERNRLLESVIKMYEFHITNFKALKSYQVLKEVFS